VTGGVDITAPVSDAGSDPLTAHVWGVTDDGAVIDVIHPRPVRRLLDERWPPVGLAVCNSEPLSVQKQLSITVDFVTGQQEVRVDGVPSNGTWERIESELALFAAERLDGYIAVHAAVIVHEGVAIVLPGPSGVGKSSLCIAAAEAGGSVLTDEYALIDPSSGRVSGWQRPVRVRLDGGGVERRHITVAHEPTAVALVAVLVFDGTAAPTISPISPAEAAIELMNNAVCAASRPDQSLDAALAVTRSARSVAGVRGEAAAAISELFTLLG
jgi:hypothetical protein